ncbi:unnamed protein product [Meganyctiphanes norvegica]|uniref:BZIP domain-containing protein n=1 Tax=Meganyctiphanes norvegica TaxID=48144 RepID=A0AAV2R4K6_MEGNR
MTSFQEQSTWFMDDEGDFLSVLLPDNQSGETFSNKNISDMQVSPYGNKVIEKSDEINKNFCELDKYLSNWDPGQQDHTLTESERREDMSETDKIDNFAELMLEEPSQTKTQPQQQNYKIMNNLYESNTQQIGKLENSHAENTSLYSEVKILPNTNTQKYKIEFNSEFLNANMNNEVLGDKCLTYLHQVSNPKNNKNIMNQCANQKNTPYQKVNQCQNNELQFELQIQNLPENGDIRNENQKVDEPQCSINQGVERKCHVIVNAENTQNSEMYKQQLTESEQIDLMNEDQKLDYLAELLLEDLIGNKQHDSINQEVATNGNMRENLECQKHDLGLPIHDRSTFQNENKLPVLNDERKLTVTSCTKKRKKYEEDPHEDEEEEKKRLQAKKAKKYRDKKKEELRMKDDQIKHFQEALQKCETEKNAYFLENKQLKEVIKKKNLLLQLYEGH